MCMWSSHSTDINLRLPIKEIGVVLDRPQRQGAKFKINTQKSRKLNTLSCLDNAECQDPSLCYCPRYCALTSPGMSLGQLRTVILKSVCVGPVERGSWFSALVLLCLLFPPTPHPDPISFVNLLEALLYWLAVT